MSRWGDREATRLGNQREIELANDDRAQRKAREIRAENIRRAKLTPGEGWGGFAG